MTKKILVIIFLLVLALGTFTYWAVGNSLPRHSRLDIRSIGDAIPFLAKKQVTLITYNIAHGQGVKDEPTDWRGKDYTLKKLDAIAKVIRSAKVDFALLQEVDEDSDRTYHVHQAEYLAERAGFPFIACATLWDENYLPFPFWPPEEHLGQVKAANCILSKYPISNHERLVFDKPASNPAWYNWGYIDRGAQKVTAEVGNFKVDLVNTHFEAWDIDSRHKQAKRLAKWVTHFSNPTIIGGDFNAIPSSATKRTQFKDDPRDDYSNDETIEVFQSTLRNATSSFQIIDDDQRIKNKFTFPASEPNRTLDYLFTLNGAQFLTTRILDWAGDASDHLPVWAKVSIVPSQTPTPAADNPNRMDAPQ